MFHVEHRRPTQGTRQGPTLVPNDGLAPPLETLPPPPVGERLRALVDVKAHEVGRDVRRGHAHRSGGRSPERPRRSHLPGTPDDHHCRPDPAGEPSPAPRAALRNRRVEPDAANPPRDADHPGPPGRLVGATADGHAAAPGQRIRQPTDRTRRPTARPLVRAAPTRLPTPDPVAGSSRNPGPEAQGPRRRCRIAPNPRHPRTDDRTALPITPHPTRRVASLLPSDST
jgi:hypothetical protein